MYGLTALSCLFFFSFPGVGSKSVEQTRDEDKASGWSVEDTTED